MQEKVGAVMVVGSGIAGIQAGLDLADAGFKVYLVEKEPCIGGVMPQLDKTFPTNDCAMCILAPKLVDTGRHPNIEIITNAQVSGIEGGPGGFKIRLSKSPGYVKEDVCNGCGECVDSCPVDVTSEFEEGLGLRKAIYRRYPQAIPNVFSISKGDPPPCRIACPAGCNVQGYLALTASERFDEALELIRERIPLPGTLGRICPHPCEDRCNRTEVDEPLAICSLKRSAVDYGTGSEAEQGDDVKPQDPSTPASKVAIIGAGPAGLTAAYDLTLMQRQVTIFEALPVAGGMLRVGVPEYRLPHDVLQSEIQTILDLGVELRISTRIGRDLSLQDLKKQGYDAVFIAVGAHRSRPLPIDGADLEGVLGGVTFLRDVSLGKEVKLGRRLIIIGGGNVAIDVARTARRLGVEDIHVVCLESRDEMPAFEWEIEEAVEEGVVLHPSLGPKRILGKGGKVTGLETLVCTSVFDEQGRFSPAFKEKSEETIQGDTVIIAIGQAADLSFLGEGSGIRVTPGGTVKADPVTLETSVPGIFAGGDVVSGPALAVDAIAQGHEAAESIDRYLKGEDMKRGRVAPETRTAEKPDRKVEIKARQRMRRIALERRLTSFDELEAGFTREQAVEEAKRCLNCGICSECFQCVKTCKKDAIDHEMKEENIELEVGALILALGFDEFDPLLKREYGYGRYPNVLSSIEFERMLSASGPYKGHLVRRSDDVQPKKIAWIQCVGSRDLSQKHEYCSSVCCMYATKEAVIAKEHLSRELECHIYFMDMRSYGKEFDKYCVRAEAEYGISFRRSRVASVEEVDNKGTLRVKYEGENGELLDDTYDLVVLSVGLTPPKNIDTVSNTLGIELNKYGFIKTEPHSPVETTRPGIFVCGASSGPKDIPETVAQASGAACKASGLLSDVRSSLVSGKVYPEERDISGEEPRIGAFVCNCGINIGGYVNVPEVAEYAKDLPNVVYAEDNLYTCSQDTQEKIKEKIEEHRLNRVVVASCTPRTHEPLFQDTIREVGLNPFLLEFVNIRDQCSWVHMSRKEEATQKAKDLVRMGVTKAALLRPIKVSTSEVDPKALVIGGGVSGLTSAVSLSEQGFEVYLVEREAELGGNLRQVRYNLDGDDPQEVLRKLIEGVEGDERIHVFTNSEVAEVAGYVGNFRTTLKEAETGEQKVLEHGIIVVATGAVEHRPEKYLYGEDERVMTQSELERRLADSAPEVEG
ncbi:MAG: NAD(P)-binding protein, partial [bacterium]